MPLKRDRIPRPPARLLASLCLLLFAAACSGPATDDVTLGPHLDAGARALAGSDSPGPDAFLDFRAAVAASARAAGEEPVALAVEALESGRQVARDERALAARLLRAYVVARYGERIVRDLQSIVGFPTFAVEGRPNWDAPPFLEQRAWLQERAGQLGLSFRSFDGRVDEISLEGGERVLGVLTHGDVQDVDAAAWSSPPWEGRLVDDRIVGRGTEDDKGPIVTTMHVFAALRDSGWPLDATLRLIVSNGEESSWEEIPYYLERRPAPDVTLGVDAAYPVTHAQKAWCRIDLTVDPTPRIGRSGSWEVISVSGGSGLSMIPARGKALLHPPDTARSRLDDMKGYAEGWIHRNAPAELLVEREGSAVAVTALGRGGHSSQPEIGHNALGDLTAFLATLPLVEESGWNVLVQVVGRLIGTDTEGVALGIDHDDDVMGRLTLNLGLLDEDAGRPRARISVRVPRGIDRATIEARVRERIGEFERRFGAKVTIVVDMPREPHFVEPDGPLVRTLLDVWEEVTGQAGQPVAIGGGTQAQLFPDGVDFGPALGMEAYRGHGPDEYMTIDELRQNAELTIAALWRLAGDGD